MGLVLSVPSTSTEIINVEGMYNIQNSRCVVGCITKSNSRKDESNLVKIANCEDLVVYSILRGHTHNERLISKNFKF